MHTSTHPSRREFIRSGGLFAVAATAFGTARLFAEDKDKKNGGGEEDVSPAEDLMREHGS